MISEAVIRSPNHSVRCHYHRAIGPTLTKTTSQAMRHLFNNRIILPEITLIIAIVSEFQSLENCQNQHKSLPVLMIRLLLWRSKSSSLLDITISTMYEIFIFRFFLEEIKNFSIFLSCFFQNTSEFNVINSEAMAIPPRVRPNNTQPVSNQSVGSTTSSADRYLNFYTLYFVLLFI